MTDRELIDLYFQRSEEAISATESLYGHFCLAIAIRILGNREDAAEVVNDSYLKLWNLIPPQVPDPFRGFLGRITRQLSINRLEAATAQKRGGSQYPAALEELEEIASGESLDPETRIALRDALEHFLLTLSPQKRRCFLLRYWHFHSVEEIARLMGVTQSKVKMQLLRTRQQLQAYLQKEELL